MRKESELECGGLEATHFGPWSIARVSLGVRFSKRFRTDSDRSPVPFVYWPTLVMSAAEADQVQRAVTRYTATALDPEPTSTLTGILRPDVVAGASGVRQPSRNAST